MYIYASLGSVPLHFTWAYSMAVHTLKIATPEQHQFRAPCMSVCMSVCLSVLLSVCLFIILCVCKHGTQEHSELRLINLTRKGFQKKPIVAFTNSTVFILDFNI